jgi:hypothetical protein
LDCFLGQLENVRLAGRYQTVPEMLAAISRFHPVLVVVDTWHAFGSAVELTEVIRSNWPKQRCLLLGDTVAIVELARSQGAESILFWQLWPDKLAAKIESVAGGGPNLRTDPFSWTVARPPG